MSPRRITGFKVGDGVIWQGDTNDRGKVADRDWSGVKIQWNDGGAIYYYHNDMNFVTRLPAVDLWPLARSA